MYHSAMCNEKGGPFSLRGLAPFEDRIKAPNESELSFGAFVLSSHCL